MGPSRGIAVERTHSGPSVHVNDATRGDVQSPTDRPAHPGVPPGPFEIRSGTPDSLRFHGGRPDAPLRCFERPPYSTTRGDREDPRNHAGSVGFRSGSRRRSPTVGPSRRIHPHRHGSDGPSTRSGRWIEAGCEHKQLDSIGHSDTSTRTRHVVGPGPSRAPAPWSRREGDSTGWGSMRSGPSVGSSGHGEGCPTGTTGGSGPGGEVITPRASP